VELNKDLKNIAHSGNLFYVLFVVVHKLFLGSRTLFYFLVRCSGRPENARDLQVRLGGILATDPDPDVAYAHVSHVIPHPDHNGITFQNDIGLLRLSNPVRYTDTILPICLPPSNVNLDQFKVCVDTGFGQTSWTGLFYLHFAFLYHHYT